MAVDARRDHVERALSDGDGILRLAPAWVARDYLPPGGRLGTDAGSDPHSESAARGASDGSLRRRARTTASDPTTRG